MSAKRNQNVGGPNDGEDSRFTPRYRPFTGYTNRCRCGVCFIQNVWVEQGPDEQMAAVECGRIIYQLTEGERR